MRKTRRFKGPQNIQSEIDVLIAESKLRTSFHPKVLQMARGFSDKPNPNECRKRRNLKSLPLCTIDGETAKDFDDAVYAAKQGKNTQVLVAIADVAHYVEERSPLDIEALKRATSIYYPGHCIPMIPEALSNGLCSLKPKVPRLCMTVEFQVTPAGSVKDVKLGEAVMKSHARLTYTQVQKLLDSNFKGHSKIPERVTESIQNLKQASLALRKARFKRGSIDFDATEALIALNKQGEPIAIDPSERLEAHRLIEDLMIAANEAVARYLEERKFPGIFRIHEPPNPDKLDEFSKLAQSLGAMTPALDKELKKAPKNPASLAKILESLKTHPAKDTLQSAMLRSMMQARYAANNLGHYGLASTSYLHFTSPIRRYPDLLVHRIVKESFKSQKKTRDLKEIALHCSDLERKAVDLERNIHALHAAWFLKDKVGQFFDAKIVSKVDFGFFVRLNQHHVEGLVHIKAIPPGVALKLRVGDPIRIQVANVNVGKRFIDFSWVQQNQA